MVSLLWWWPGVRARIRAGGSVVTDGYRAAGTSRAALLTSATQWYASGFVAIAAATAVAIAITAVRRAHARRTMGQ